jgi:hypothetical protein
VVSDADHDRVWRQAMVKEMTAGSEQMYSADETGAIAEGLSLFAAVRTGEGKTRAAKHKSTVDWARTKHHEHSGLMIGEAQAMVRGFCQDIVAYLVHFDSRHFASDSGIGRMFAVLERKNLHHIVTFMEFRQHVFRARTFVNSVVWQQISDRPLTFVVVGVPCDHHHLAPSEQAGCVRAEGRRVLRLTHVNESLTKVEYACSVDLKGHVPRWCAKQFVIPALMNLVYKMQSYFQQIRQPAECGAEDGTTTGMMLVDAVHSAAGTESEQALLLREFVMHTAMLRECDFGSLDAMLVAVIIDKSGGTHQDMHAVLTQDPMTLTEKDATVLGVSLQRIVRAQASLKPAAAVGELIHRCAYERASELWGRFLRGWVCMPPCVRYAVVNRVSQKHAWFQPMLEAIVESHFVRSSLRQKLRLTKANLTSMILGSSAHVDRPRRGSDSSTESIVLFRLSKGWSRS